VSKSRSKSVAKPSGSKGKISAAKNKKTKSSKSKSAGKSKEKGSKGKKSEKKEDEGKPHRAPSAYIFFNTATVKRLKEEEGVPHADAFKKAGEIWHKLSADEKKKYDAMHDKEVKRYEK